MEIIQVKAEFLCELKDKDDWVRRVPRILPSRTRAGETLIWIDKNGSVFETGEDFEAAEQKQTYPCRTVNVANDAN